MVESISLGRDLTDLARRQLLDPVVGREAEIDQVLRVLCRRTKSNPLLLGEPGVGKTALVEGLAQLMVSGVVPRPLRGRRLVELQLGSLMAGTQFRGDLEKRVQDFLFAARRDRTLVFIDEIHLLVVAGRGSGMDAANLLKPILARGEVPCLGATTPLEAAEMFRTDPAMERRFQPVIVVEPDADAVRAMLFAARPRLEVHHELSISEGAINAAVQLSLQRKTTRQNPDRALDILEDACAAEQLRAAKKAAPPASFPELHELEAEVQAAAVALDVFRHVRARERVDACREKWEGSRRATPDSRGTVLPEHVFAQAGGSQA